MKLKRPWLPRSGTRWKVRSLIRPGEWTTSTRAGSGPVPEALPSRARPPPACSAWPRRSSRRDSPMPLLSYLRAINRALGDEMERDPDVFVMGEDVHEALTNTTVGLLSRFGPQRVVETPLSEQGFTGFATGAALAGLRPVVEYQIPFLLLLVFEQIANQANKVSLMSGGQASVPVA